MITVGCAGFAVPATRYFKEYRFVEIQETHLAVPGQGTLRRWQREAPVDFDFALLGPREIGQESFKEGSVLENALSGLKGVASELKAKTVVFLAPQDFAQNRANKSALKAFLNTAKGIFGGVVFDAGPHWKPDDADSLAEDTGTIAVRDPLQHGLSKRKVAYYRLPGPAGHKSRYEDPAIDRLAEIVKGGPKQQATYVFANVDMFTDAKRFRKAAGIH
jgi:uncharacterized protein YecE (DUF72 family)